MKQKFFSLFALLIVLLTAACNNQKTYIEMLEDEQAAISNFLSDKKILYSVPDDGNFDKNAYYALASGVYMQVLSPGNLEEKAVAGIRVDLRYTYTNLLTNKVDEGNFNSPLSSPLSFTYQTSSTDVADGLQLPLKYVGNEAIVNVLVPSKVGSQSDANYVIPVLYKVQYNFRVSSDTEGNQ